MPPSYPGADRRCNRKGANCTAAYTKRTYDKHLHAQIG
jgi:hypothetical protein